MDKRNLLLEGSNSCEDFEWEDLTLALTEIMEERNPSGLWKAEMKNFGWKGVNGEKTFTTNDGKEMLNKILPNTDCSFKIYKYGRNGIAINNAHHDSPMWAEWYYITKAKEK